MGVKPLVQSDRGKVSGMVGAGRSCAIFHGSFAGGAPGALKPVQTRRSDATCQCHGWPPSKLRLLLNSGASLADSVKKAAKLAPGTPPQQIGGSPRCRSVPRICCGKLIDLDAAGPLKESCLLNYFDSFFFVGGKCLRLPWKESKYDKWKVQFLAAIMGKYSPVGLNPSMKRPWLIMAISYCWAWDWDILRQLKKMETHESMSQSVSSSSPVIASSRCDFQYSLTCASYFHVTCICNVLGMRVGHAASCEMLVFEPLIAQDMRLSRHYHACKACILCTHTHI